MSLFPYLFAFLMLSWFGALIGGALSLFYTFLLDEDMDIKLLRRRVINGLKIGVALGWALFISSFIEI